MVPKRKKKVPESKVVVDVSGSDPFDITRRLGAVKKLGFKAGRGAIAGTIGRFEGAIKDSKLDALRKLPGIVSVEKL